MSTFAKTAKKPRTKNADGKSSYFSRLRVDLVRNRQLYLLIIPVILFYILFHYVPMYGAQIAFRDYSPTTGITGSPWVGLEHFIDFFQGRYFWRLLRNTVTLSLAQLIFGFPLPIILALLINELKSKAFSKTVQTITYMPHFISTVVICGMIIQFTRDDGFITQILTMFGFEERTMLSDQNLFVPVYVISSIWQQTGWSSIIYLAALTGIDPQLYEAAKIDGANKWHQIINVTVPSILPTVIILLIMKMGTILGVGYEKVILLYNPAIYETADIISSYVYRRGLLNGEWSYSTAVGLFNSVVNFSLVIFVNWLSDKTSETSLW